MFKNSLLDPRKRRKCEAKQMQTLFPGNKSYCAFFLPMMILLVVLVVPASAMITANPNPVNFSGNTQTPGMTTIQWDAGTVSKKPYSVYYTTNGAGETFFAEGKQGIQPATFIQLGSKYQFCLWGNNKAKKIDCVKVTTQGLVKGGGGITTTDFIRNVNVDPGFQSATFTFTTDKFSLPVVSVSTELPLPFDAVSKNDEKVFQTIDRTNFAQPGTSHQSSLPNLNPDTFYHYVIIAHENASGLYYRVNGTFHTKTPLQFQKVHLNVGYIDTMVSFVILDNSVSPIIQVSEKAPRNFEMFGTQEPISDFFNPADIVSAATSSGAQGVLRVVDLKNLHPDTSYHYVMSAVQEDHGIRYWSNYQGQFRTMKLTRTVTVTFDELVGFSDFSYDVYFYFCVNGKQLPEAEFGPSELHENERTKLNWYGRTFSTTLTDSPDKLLIQVRAFHSNNVWSCGQGGAPPCSQWDDGSGDCGQWSVAQTSFDITGKTPFNFVVLAQPKASTGSEVKFGVSGTIDVQYQQIEY